jgi:hypothetical protein
MIDPAQTCLFIPTGLRSVKLALFSRIGDAIKRTGGQVVRGDVAKLAALSEDITPIIGCSPELRPLIDEWIVRKRNFLYWDRGYARRVYATWLPRGENGGYYRWSRNSYQLQHIRDVPDDRWKALKTDVKPWAKHGRHIVIAAPTPTYSRFHALKDWTDTTLDTLARNTDRQIVIRGKETKRPLQYDLEGAHALVAHGSNAAVEAAVLGCPVFVDPSSAAALVGLTDLTKIERPIYPDRQPWLNALSYAQFNEAELINGTLWEHLT